MKTSSRLKLFGINNLLLETELLEIEDKGIDMGHAQFLKIGEVVDIEAFELDIRKQAKQMTNVYYLVFCLENSIRKLITDRLQEKSGATWWETNVPDSVRKKVAFRQKGEMETAFSERSAEPICYSDFLDLVDIIELNWADFSDSFRSIESVKSTLTTLNMIRRTVAHNSVLDEDEIQRLKLHVKDWIRIQM